MYILSWSCNSSLSSGCIPASSQDSLQTTSHTVQCPRVFVECSVVDSAIPPAALGPVLVDEPDGHLDYPLHTVRIGFRSGDIADWGSISTPFCAMKLVTRRARCAGLLSCWKQKFSWKCARAMYSTTLTVRARRSGHVVLNQHHDGRRPKREQNALPQLQSAWHKFQWSSR